MAAAYAMNDPTMLTRHAGNQSPAAGTRARSTVGSHTTRAHYSRQRQETGSERGTGAETREPMRQY